MTGGVYAASVVDFLSISRQRGQGTSGDYMARTDSSDMGGDNSGAASKQTVINAEPGEAVSVADAAFISNSDILRDGQDLILQAPDGSEVVIENYFGMDPAPAITGPGGAMLTPELVNSFVRSVNPQYAANEQGNDESPVGAVQEVKGTATVTRADGTVETVTVGTVIFQGDVVETEGDGAVNIVFIDETSFAISENAKMAIDEYVFDPSSESGTQNFSVLRGMFVFTSGLIGRDDPDDVEIDTPVGSIGIRGTTIAGNLNTGEITVVEGAIVLRGHDGQEVTLATQFETGRFNSANGTVEVVGVLDGKAVSLTFVGMGAVVPAFFAAIGVTPTEDTSGNNGQGPNNAGSGSNTGEGAQPEAGAETQDQSAVQPEPQPLNADLSMDVAATSNPFEQTNSFDSAADTSSSTAVVPLAGASTSSAGSPAPVTSTTTTTTEPVDASAAVTPPPPPVVTVVPPPAPNVFAPVLTASTTFTMPEDSVLNTPVSGILGTDADGNALSYSLSGGGGMFAISGGSIVINGALNFEAATTHSLTVTVTDGVFTTTETYTVNITDVNEVATFASSTAAVTISEAMTPGTVYTAVATDPEGNTITYSLAGATAGFTINSGTGAISFAGPATIDYEVVGSSVTLEVIATSSLMNSAPHYVTINITNQDDTSPVLTGTGTANTGTSVAEGGVVGITAAMLQAADPDTAAGSITYSITGTSFGSVRLTTAPATPVTSFTQADINAGLVIFQHDDTSNAAAGFTFSVADGTNAALTGQTFTITATLANDTPTMNVATPTMTGTAEDAVGASHQVSTLLSGSATDEETATASIGMAITAADNTNGTWQYSADGGTTWNAVGTVSGASALLVAATDLIRFNPAANYNGTAAFSYKAWDGSTGMVHTAVNTSTGTAFSATENTGTVTISAVSDNPFVDLDTTSGSINYNTTYNEGTPAAIVGANIALGDVDGERLTQVTAIIDSPPNGAMEKLYFIGSAPFLTARGITITGDGTGSLTLTGNGSTTAVQYAEVLQLIRYDNGNDNMTGGNRTINVVATDVNSNVSFAAAVTLNVIPVTDNDTFTGTNNIDSFIGDAGNDTVVVSDGNDSYNGGGGINTLDFSGATGNVSVNLGGSPIALNGFGDTGAMATGFQNVVGSNQNDTITGTGADNAISGENGDDTITGAGGTDTLSGGGGNDTFIINVASSSSIIDGGLGNDTYYASSMTGPMTVDLNTGAVTHGAGTDTVSNIENFTLGTGADTVVAKSGVYNINAGTGGVDSIDFSGLTESADINLGTGVAQNAFGLNITMSNFETAIGTAFDDTFTGNAGANTFIGGGGNDLIYGSGGNNTYNGGDDLDTVSYASVGASVSIDLNAGTGSNGYGGTDTLNNIERIVGTNFDDTIKGKIGVADIMIGGDGNDAIFAQGNDTVSGNAGNDTFMIGTSFIGMNVDGGGNMDTLSLNSNGVYDFTDFASLQGVETIDATAGGVTANMTIALTASMLTGLTGNVLTINMNAGDTLDLDFSAFTGGDQFALSNTGAGTQSYYSAGLDRTVTINSPSGLTVSGAAPLGGGLNLNTMGAANGYVIEDDLGFGFGHSLSTYAGDLDGDGLEDFVVTRAREETASSIAMFEVSGTTTIVGNINLGSAGGRILPQSSILTEGGSANSAIIASIRDWNNDGVEDFIVAAYGGNSPDGIGGVALGAGAVQIVSGANGALLTELTEALSGDQLGRSVSSAGDLNGDGYMDMIIGSPEASAGANTGAGKAYILFGEPTIPSEVGLVSASPSQLLVISGTADFSQLGRNVQGIGDFNNDGRDDVAISEVVTPGVGRVHVVLGSQTPGVTLGTSTFTIDDVNMGSDDEIQLLAMGDINGDGIADLGVGSAGATDTGALHIFFGGGQTAGGVDSATTADATFSTGNPNVNIIGAGAVGDFNADGIDDFGIAMMNTTSSVIDMYVVYGGALTGNWDQSNLNIASNAFHISYNVPVGTDANDLNVVMSAIGDVNGDGFSDVGIGIANVDNDLGVDSDGDTDVNNDYDGMVAVVYGSNSGGNTNIAALGVSQNSDQTLLGTSGDDTLHQGSGGHTGLVFRGGAGNDLIGLANSMASIADIDGGSGWDRLEFLIPSQTLNFTGLTAENFKGIDEISFGIGQNNQTIRLTLQEIFTIIESSDSQLLIIEDAGGAGSLLQIEDGTAANPGVVDATGLATALGMSEGAHDATYYNFYQGDNVLLIATSLIDGNMVQVT